MKLTYSIADQHFKRTKSLGIFNFSINLLRVLAHRKEISELTVLANESLRDSLNIPAHVQVRFYRSPIMGSAGRLWWDQWALYQTIPADPDSWLFLPKGYASFVRACPVRLASFIHDAIHDYYQHHYPKIFSRAETEYFLRCFRATIRESGIIFTNSDFSRSEILRMADRFGLPPPPVITMGIGFSNEDPALSCGSTNTTGTRRHGVMVLTGRWPHKRSAMALQYLELWRTSTKFSGPIYLVGSLPDGLAVPDKMTFLPRLPKLEYADLLRKSQILVFTSEYEGFGMPPVEATLAGTCPVYSDLPVTREVMQGAGFAFQNDHPDSFIDAMNRAIDTLPSTIEAWGHGLRIRHNWDTFATRMIQGLNKGTDPGKTVNHVS